MSKNKSINKYNNNLAIQSKHKGERNQYNMDKKDTQFISAGMAASNMLNKAA